MTLMRLIVVFAVCLVAPALAQVGEPSNADALDAPQPKTLPTVLRELAERAPGQASPAPESTEWLRAGGHDTVVCPFRGRIDYEPGEIECGLIKVPENREKPGSRTIELHFVRIAARGEDDEGNEVEVRDDPVIYLTGGPGVMVENYVRRLKDHGVVDRRDLYILEQRGIGSSGDFCPFFGQRNRAEHIADNFEDQQLAMLDQARECIESAKAAGVDVTGYHTFENARDVRALRMALGFDDWNVWGISYGSVLGQAYMQVDPEGIRAAVIDAIVPLDLENLMRIPHWHDRNLERLFAACNEQPACREEYGELEARHRRAIGDMTGNPVSVDVPESEIHPGGKAWFFQDLIAGLPFGLLYEQSNHPALPAVIHGLTRAAERRDETFFRALALAGTDMGPGLSWGMALSVRCMDRYMTRLAEASPSDFEQYPVLAPAFGSLEMIERAPEVCRDVGLAPRPAEAFEPTETDLPVVVANGRWDPITPVPLAEAIMPGFPNGELVVFPHAGHGPTRSLECAGDFLNGFFDDPAAPLDRECVEDGEEAAEYIAPYFATKAMLHGIILAEDPERDFRLKFHAAWGGGSAVFALLGFLVLSLAWISRRLNADRLESAGGSRLLVWLGSALATAWLAGIGLAIYMTYEVTEAMLLFGLVPWAFWITWLAPASGLLAIAGLVQTWRNGQWIHLAARIGLWLTGLATISLSVFGLVWRLWPFG